MRANFLPEFKKGFQFHRVPPDPPPWALPLDPAGVLLDTPMKWLGRETLLELW